MAVYTSLSLAHAQQILAAYEIGQICCVEGITAGFSNSNFLITSQQNRFVLTLYETKGGIEDMLRLLHHMQDTPLKSVRLRKDSAGRSTGQYKNRCFVLYEFEQGQPLERSSQSQRRQLATWLGRFHAKCLAIPLADYADHKVWYKKVADTCLAQLNQVEQEFLQKELRMQSLFEFQDLPQGVIHGDLFRDNVLFERDQLKVVLDFENTGRGPLLLDVAIVVNDWCNEQEGRLNLTAVQDFLAYYHQQRPLTPIEQGAWPMMLRRAALRFYLSRLQAHHFPREGQLVGTRDPQEYKNRLVEIVQRETQIGNHWPSCHASADVREP